MLGIDAGRRVPGVGPKMRFLVLTLGRGEVRVTALWDTLLFGGRSATAAEPFTISWHGGSESEAG